MRAAPIRFLNAALWPATIWSSLTHLEEHPADDYVERTSPIVATAIAFWIAAAALVGVLWLAAGRMVTFGDGLESWAARVAPTWTGTIEGVLWFFVPTLYLVGLWLFSAREGAFPR